MKKLVIFLVLVTSLVSLRAYSQLESGGYYRIRHMETYGERYLSVTGNVNDKYISFTRSLSSTSMLSDSAQLSDPGTILYIEGKSRLDGGMDSVYAIGQDVNTFKLSGHYFTVN